MAVDNLFGTFDESVPEIINRAITMYAATIDDVFASLTTSTGVSRDQFGRDWQVKKLVQGSLAGVVEFDDSGSSATNSVTLAGDNVTEVDRFYFNDQTFSEYPDPSAGANPRQQQMIFGLMAYRAALDRTLAEFRVDAHPAAIGERIASKLMGFVRNILRVHATSFYADNEDGRIGTVGTVVSQTNPGTGAPSTAVIIISELATLRFEVGMGIDLYTSGGTRRNEVTAGRLPLVISGVDPYNDRITIMDKSGTLFDTANATVVGDILYNPRGKSRTHGGINSWVKDSGTLYNLSLDVWPEKKSLIITDGGVLTEKKLRLWLNKFDKARQYHGVMLDTMLTRDGVWAAYMANKAPQIVLNRPASGAPLGTNQEGNSAGLTFIHNGRAIRFSFTDYLPSGQMFGLKLADNNLKRYVPPRTPGVGQFDNAPGFAEIEFPHPLLSGTGSIWSVKTGANGLATQMSYTYGDSRMNLVPDETASLKVSGLTEDVLTV